MAHVVAPGEPAARIEADARRIRRIPANRRALGKLLISQAFENMGLRTTRRIGTLFDGIARQSSLARHRYQLATLR